MKWRFNIASLVVLVFIFFNDIGLPYGLQYTALLAPFFFLKYALKYWKTFAVFLGGALIYALLHLSNYELTWFYYFRSFTLHFLVFIQVVAFFHVVNHKPHVVKQAFDYAVYLNFLMMLIGFGLLFLGYPKLMFEVTHVSKSIGVMARFRIFTAEPSYYSMLMAPILLFYIAQRCPGRIKIDLEKIILIVIPLMVSFSFGVLSMILFSLFVVYFLRVKNILIKERRMAIFAAIALVVVALGALYIVSPDNPLFVRFDDIISGNDSSGKGRVTQPWILAFRMLAKHGDYLFGIGWGQIRIIGHDVIKSFYQYTEIPQNKFGLPNILTEITAMFGLVGLIMVLFFQILMYRVTKVYKSTYRSLVFWFIFIYQFTGSYSSSVLYYCYWVLAFSPAFDLQVNRVLEPIINSKKKEEE